MIQKILLWLLGVGLTTSLIGNLLLARWARDYYLALNRINLDPAGLGYYDSATAKPKEAGRKRVVFYGDSRAFAWPAPATFAEYDVLNRGIGGQTTTQILARFDEHVAPLQPDVVIIQAGINDLKTVGLFPEQRADILAATKANLNAMVQRSRSLGAVVILTTIFPTAQPSLIRRPFWSAEIAVASDEVNDYLRGLADDGTDDAVLLFDSARILAGSNGAIQPQFSHDLLHLNAEGYAALNEQLAHFVY